MILDKKQCAEFESAARPLIEWLKKKLHPHVTAIVTSTEAELLEGVCTTGIVEHNERGGTSKR